MCSPTYASYLELDQERKWETFHTQRKKQHQREQILVFIYEFNNAAMSES